MKKLFLSLGLALAMSGVAQAKTPPEVIKSYKAYNAAMEQQNFEAARKHAYDAWQTAEDLMGDSKTTGDLALNFAQLKSDKKNINKKREKAYERAVELTAHHNSDAPLLYMERTVALMNFYTVTGNRSSAFKAAKRASEYAADSNLTSTTFYAEALTQQAGYHASRGKHRKAETVAAKALKAFERKTDDIQSVYPILANLYEGYGFEGQDKSMEAALSYQKVMEALDGIDPDEHPLAAKALGRWSHMRAVLNNQGKLEEAENKGLCKCWPYDRPRNESLKPLKRKSPKMPSNAYVSGFSILQFDLDDAGKPINEEILVSWPENVYDKSSLRALKQWEYTPRVEGETKSEREDLVVTLRYIWTDEFGNVIF